MENTIKGITISQPFASLIADGEKWVENRTWQPNYRGLLAIHAGKGTQYLSRHELRSYPTGCIVAVAVLRTWVLLDHARACFEKGKLPYAGWTREGLTDADMERLLSHEHTEGPWCWILTDVHKLTDPVPCPGRQGLWDVDVALELPMTIGGDR